MELLLQSTYLHLNCYSLALQNKHLFFYIICLYGQLYLQVFSYIYITHYDLYLELLVMHFVLLLLPCAYGMTLCKHE